MKKLIILFLVIFLIVGCSNEVKSSNVHVDNGQIDKLLEEVSILELNILNLKDEKKIVTDNLKVVEEKNVLIMTELDKANSELLNMDDVEIMSAISPYPGMPVMIAAFNILEALQTNDYAILASYVEPANGVKLSPNQNVDLFTAVELSDVDILNLNTIVTTYNWGMHPASGDPIVFTPLDYFDEYVYDENYYIAPIIGQNIVVSNGNLVNNISSVYLYTHQVEFYFPEFDPSYGGLDWSSITLIISVDSGSPMLLGIAHGEWTP